MLNFEGLDADHGLWLELV